MNQSDSEWDGISAIRAARLAQNDAIASHDLEEIMRYWTPDVVVTASRGSVAIGAENYLASLADTFNRFADAAYVRTPGRIRPSTVPDLALEEGTWVGTWTDDGRPVRVSGSYMAQWRFDDGAWRIRSEVFVATECVGCDGPGREAAR